MGLLYEELRKYFYLLVWKNYVWCSSYEEDRTQDLQFRKRTFYIATVDVHKNHFKQMKLLNAGQWEIDSAMC